jgi:hypothetical protein
MEPAESGEVVVVMVTVDFPVPDVMRLEPRDRATAVGRAQTAVPASTHRRIRPETADRAFPTASGAPSWVRAVISQVDSQRMRSSVPGPTLGPDAIHTPDSPSEGAASLASTITVV